MENNSKTAITRRWAFALSIILPLTAAAEPVGDVLPFNDSGQAMMSMSGKSLEDVKAAIPSRESVGLPIYPGSVYTSQYEGDGMLPGLVMASSDPIDEVTSWYQAQDGLTWSEQWGLFHAGDNYEMMKTESVYLQDISADPSVSAGGLVFDMRGMKTQITISYEPKTSE